MTDTVDRLPLPDRTFLTYQQAARIFQCSVDRLRRIPPDMLPRYQLGRFHGVFWEDLVAYIRRYCRVEPGPHIENLISEVESHVLNSTRDGVPRRATRSKP